MYFFFFLRTYNRMDKAAKKATRKEKGLGSLNVRGDLINDDVSNFGSCFVGDFWWG